MPVGVMTPTVLRTDWRCAGGTIVATLPAVVDGTLEQTLEGSLVMKRLTLIVPLTWDQYDQVAVGRVVELAYRDASTTPPTDDWEEYRITDVVEDVAAGRATLTATWWIQDLLERDGLVYQTVGAETRFEFSQYAIAPADALAWFVSGSDRSLPSYWAVGTVTPTATGDLTHVRASNLTAALTVAALAKRLTGVAYEIWPSRNGTTGLYLNLTVFGSGTFDLRTGKNLGNLRRTQRRAEQTTRVAFDQDGAMRRPTYVITAISAGAYIEVQDVSAIGPGPAREDDQWNGAAWIEEKNGTSHTVTDTVKVSFSTTRLHMSSTTGMATGERGYLAVVGGADLAYVDSPSLQATYGKRLGVIAGDDPATNYIRGADLRSGSATTPTGWTLVTGTCARKDVTTGLVRYGGASYYFTALGQLQQSLTIYAVAGEVWTYSWGGFIGAFAANATVKFRDPQAGTDTTITLDGSDPAAAVLNTYVTVSRSFNITTTGAKTFIVTVTLGGAGGAFYFDAAQLTRTAAAVPFRLGSGAADNVARGNAYLDANGDPLTTYDVAAADLAVLDPRTYGDDRPQLGMAAAYLTEGTLGEVRTPLRIVRMATRLADQARPDLQFSTRPRRVTRLVAV